MTLRKLLLTLLLAPLLTTPLRAQETLVTFKSMSVDLALALARGALADCQKQGFQVTVAVVDRFGVTQVLLRDRFAGAHTVPTATGQLPHQHQRAGRGYAARLAAGRHSRAAGRHHHRRRRDGGSGRLPGRRGRRLRRPRRRQRRSLRQDRHRRRA